MMVLYSLRLRGGVRERGPSVALMLLVDGLLLLVQYALAHISISLKEHQDLLPLLFRTKYSEQILASALMPSRSWLEKV